MIPGSTQSAVHNINIQPNGDILVSGKAVIAGVSKPFEAKFDNNGVIDPTFGPNGNGINILF